MSRPFLFRAPLAIAAIALAGCPAFTGPINSKPVINGITVTADDARQTLTFTADASDPDGDPITFSWSVKFAMCEAFPTSADMPPATGTGNSGFEVIVPDTNPICVYLLVTDSHGSTKFDWKQASAANSPPVAEFEILQPGGSFSGTFPLYTDFRLTAAPSSDPDGDAIATHTWAFTAAPDASTARLPNADCGDDDTIACFTADALGPYEVSLTVADRRGGVSTRRLRTIKVDRDTPPCLDGAGVAVRPGANPAEPQTFSVTVKDDGDPFPLGPHAKAGFPLFTWSIRRNTEGWRTLASYSLPELTIAPGELTIGDRIDVRVDVADRAYAVPASCGDASTCTTSSTCAQRLTWTVVYQ